MRNAERSALTDLFAGAEDVEAVDPFSEPVTQRRTTLDLQSFASEIVSEQEFVELNDDTDRPGARFRAAKRPDRRIWKKTRRSLCEICSPLNV